MGTPGNMILALIGYLLFGLVVGLVARLLMPGRDPMGWLGTIVLGCAGSFVGGLLARALFHDNNGVGFVGSLIGAMLLLWIYRMVTGRRRHSWA